MRTHINISHQFSGFWAAAEAAGSGSGRFPPLRQASPAFDAARVKEALIGAFNHVVATLFLWIERSRQRQTLGTLDDRLLSDIGVGRAEAAAEAGKPFWRA